MRRMDEPIETAAVTRPADLAFSNGLGILMRARRRLLRREGAPGRDLAPVLSDRWLALLTGQSSRRPEAGKMGAR